LWFAMSKLTDNGFVGHARDEHSDHAHIYNVGKLGGCTRVESPLLSICRL
jgi:hypothetical protein